MLQGDTEMNISALFCSHHYVFKHILQISGKNVVLKHCDKCGKDKADDKLIAPIVKKPQITLYINAVQMK
jgi:hypothetical protein